MSVRMWMQLAYIAAGVLNACVVCKAMKEGYLSTSYGVNLFFMVYFAVRAATI